MATRAGFLGQAEVVDVTFDPRVLPFKKLLAHAHERTCADAVHTTTAAQLEVARTLLGDRARALSGDVRGDKEPKYYLLQTPFRAVPMTELQATRVNARVRTGGFDALLSPRQHAAWQTVKSQPQTNWPVAVDRPIAEAWSMWQAAGAATARGSR